jgi:hypothetical protein
MIMKFDITSAAIATLISTAVNVFINLKMRNGDEAKRLQEQLHDINKISIEYPYFEDPEFTNKWNNRGKSDPQYLRYENYCAIIFNFLERLFYHCNFNDKKINGYVNAKDWVRNHQQCWENPTSAFENADSYPKRFRERILEYLKNY